MKNTSRVTKLSSKKTPRQGSKRPSQKHFILLPEPPTESRNTCEDRAFKYITAREKGLTPVGRTSISEGDQAIANEAASSLLRVFNPHFGRSSGLMETPARFVRAWTEMTAGYRMDPGIILKTFDEKQSCPVTLTGIRFTSLCEHHCLPFSGTATVAYLPGPDGRVVGVSKLARLVECFAKRFQVQERLTQQVADALALYVSDDVAVVIRAHHSCMGCRGVRQPDAVMSTSVMLGKYRSEGALRNEFLAQVEK